MAATATRIERVDFRCPCGQPLTARILREPKKAARLLFHGRPRPGAEVRDAAELHHCPRCQQRLEPVSADEFLVQVFRTP